MDSLTHANSGPCAKHWVLPSLVFLTLLSWAGRAQDVASLDVKADSLSVTRDWSELTATGHVKITYEKGSIEAQHVRAKRLSPEIFQIEAVGPIAFQGEGVEAKAQTVTARLKLRETQWTLETATLAQAILTHDSGTLQAQEISLQQENPAWDVAAIGGVVFTEKDRVTQAQKLTLKLRPDDENKIIADSAILENFEGQAQFSNPVGEEHTIRFQGQTAKALFKNNQMQQLDILNGGFTTCTCDASIPNAAYALQAEKFWLFTDQFLIATNIVIKVYGIPIFWTPIYLAPLKEQQKSPLLPEIGQSPTRGWFARWRVPFFLNQHNMGFISLDYYSKKPEIGTGIEYNYQFSANRGRLQLYRLVGYGESYSIDWTHHLDLPLSTTLDVAASSRTGQLEQEAKKLFAQATLAGTLFGWSWRLSGSRDHYLIQPEEEEIEYSILERLPEFSTSYNSGRLLGQPLGVQFSFSYGRYREKKLHKEMFDESARLDTGLGLRLSDLSLSFLTIRAATSYRLSLYGENLRRESWEFSPGLSLKPLESLLVNTNYTFRQVSGGSPFHFDKLITLSKLSLTANAKWGNWTSVFSSAYDFFGQRYDLARFTLNYQTQPFSLALESQYDLNLQQMQKITVKAGHAPEKLWSFSAQTGYCFTPIDTDCPEGGKFADLILKFSMAKFRASAIADLNQLQLERLNAETDFPIGDKWELSLDGEYHFGSKSFSTWQIGVIHKFCHNCWQLGFYSDGDQIWLQARVTAFPMAEIEYSPTDQRLSFGGN